MEVNRGPSTAWLLTFVHMFELTFELCLTALLESEAQSVLLDIKHPAIKKQVSKTHTQQHIHSYMLINSLIKYLID